MYVNINSNGPMGSYRIFFSYRAIKVGDPEDPDNMLGAINTKEHYAKVSSHFFVNAFIGCTCHRL